MSSRRKCIYVCSCRKCILVSFRRKCIIVSFRRTCILVSSNRMCILVCSHRYCLSCSSGLSFFVFRLCPSMLFILPLRIKYYSFRFSVYLILTRYVPSKSAYGWFIKSQFSISSKLKACEKSRYTLNTAVWQTARSKAFCLNSEIKYKMWSRSALLKYWAK